MKSNNSYGLLKYLLGLYLLTFVMFTLFRVLFAYIFYDDFLVLYGTAEELQPILLKAFAKGFRYDNIVLSCLFILPLLSILLSWFVKIKLKLHLTILKVYFIITLGVLMALSCLDFPYYNYFWAHPTPIIFNWMGFGATYGMILQESSYYPYLLLYALVMVVIILYLVKAGSYTLSREKRISIFDHPLLQITLFIVAVVMCFFGTRGQFGKDHIGIYAAYFTDFTLVSNISLHPAYYFAVYITDYEAKFEELMDGKTAVSHVKKTYGLMDNDTTVYQNPLSRKVEMDSSRQVNKLNVVLVFMESMSENLLHQTVNNKPLTPYLDSLIEKSYYFENFYSAGIHTNLGVGSVFTGYPARFGKHMMGRYPQEYKGLLPALRDQGYHTSFFIPNEEVYDNMGLFLKTNGLDTLFSDKHYREEDKVNNYGVPDDFLLNFSANEISKFSDTVPFFAGILTVSNHPPYIIPQEFRGISDDDGVAIINYVDHSIQTFMEKASQTAWYDNTVFVFFGDHGKRANNHIYNMSLGYNHIPLIIYSPTFEDIPKRFSQFGGQIDIFPTLMGLLNLEYTNNSLGIDLLKEERPYMVFCSDNDMGCINDSLFYVFNPREKSEIVYDLRKTGDVTNYYEKYKNEAAEMKDYGLSILTATDYLTKEDLTGKY